MSFRPWRVVVVTYRSSAAVRACLASLRDAGVFADPSARVAVVDSGSGDETPEIVAREFPEALLDRSTENVGFAKGVNRGLRLTGSGDALLLNPDATLDASALARLRAALASDPRWAAVGPAVVDASGATDVAVRPFPSLRTEFRRRFRPLAERLGIRAPEVDAGPEGPPAVPAVVARPWISGACLLLRAEALAEVGPLDERFFLYFEETDWCLRARRAGYSVGLVPDARVFHAGGLSAAESGEKVRRGVVARHFRDSRRRYFAKHFGRPTAVAVEALCLMRAAYDGMRSVARRRFA